MTTQTKQVKRARQIHEQISPALIIIRMAQDIGSAAPAAARVLALIFGLGTLVFGALEWRWDLVPTLNWINAHGGALVASMASIYGPAVGTALLLGTPFIAKSALARWSTAFAIIGVVVFGMELFDVITNIDGARELFANWPQPAFAAGTRLEALKWWSLFLTWLFICTSGFQIIAAGCVVCFVVSLWRSGGSLIGRIVTFGVVFGGLYLWIVGI